MKTGMLTVYHSECCPLNPQGLFVYQLVCNILLKIAIIFASVFVEFDIWYYGFDLFDPPNVVPMPVR